jgi:hypothetical protein
MSKKSQSTTEQAQSTQSNFRINGVALTIAIIVFLVAFFAAIWMSSAGISDGVILAVSAVLMLVGTYILLGLKIAAQWEKAVVLRLGKFRNLAGPGAFWIIPILDPTALHLRAMNMLFEGLKEKGALVIVPSSAVDTMNLGGLSGMVALAQTKPPEA